MRGRAGLAGRPLRHSWADRRRHPSARPLIRPASRATRRSRRFHRRLLHPQGEKEGDRHAPFPRPRRLGRRPRLRRRLERAGRRGDVDVRQLPHRPGQPGAGDAYRPGVAGPGATVIGQVRRLFRGHRLGRGPGDDQQSLRRHLRGQSVDPGGELRRDGLRPPHPRGGGRMPRLQRRGADRHQRRHRADAAGRPGTVGPGLHPGARRRGGPHRAGGLRR